MESGALINISLLIIYFIYFLIEVNHDYTLALIRKFLRLAIANNPRLLTYAEEERMNENWHSWDWKGHALLATAFGALAFFYERDFLCLTIPIAVACIRMLTLNIGFAIKSNLKNKFHLGNNPIDKFLYKYFKNYWPIPIIIIHLSQVIFRIYL